MNSGQTKGDSTTGMPSRPVLLALVLVAVVGCLERLGAHSADHRAVLDLLGVMCSLRGRLACALDGHAAAAALFRLVLALAVLSSALAVLAAGAEGAVREEREPRAVDRADDADVGGGAAQAHLADQGHEPLVVVPVAFSAGVPDAAHHGERVRSLVQHHLENGAAAGGQQLANARPAGKTG